MQRTQSLRTAWSGLWYSANTPWNDQSTAPEPPVLTRVVTCPVESAMRLIQQPNGKVERPPSFVAAWTGMLGIEKPEPEPPLLTQVVSRGILPVAIQLKTTIRAIEPSTLPQLGILRRYRLYASEHESEGLVWHRLRLGFFPDVIRANAVMSHLKRHFKDARVVGVGSAERQALLSGSGQSHFLANGP